MFCLKNVLSMKCSVHEMCCLWNVLSMKCSVHEMFCLWNVLSMKCSAHEMFCLLNVLSIKCAVYKMSCPWNIIYMNGSNYINTMKTTFDLIYINLLNRMDTHTLKSRLKRSCVNLKSFSLITVNFLPIKT